MSAVRVTPRRLFSLGLAASLLGAGCAGDVAPGGRLTVDADATELTEGSTLVLRASLGTHALGPHEVRWLSRDPTTLSVRGGVAHGLFPGTAWVVATRGDGRDSVRLVVRFADLQQGQAGVRLGESASGFRLGGFAIAYETVSRDGTIHRSTSIVATTSGVTNPDGSCCLTIGDTALQISFRGEPRAGVRMLEPPVATLETRVSEQLVRNGADDVLLMVRDDWSRMRFYLPIKPATLELSRVLLPTEGSEGLIEGRVAFEAAGILQSATDKPGELRHTPIGDRTIPAYVQFSVPLRARTIRH